MTFREQLDCDSGDKCISLTPSEWATGYTLYASKITDGPIGPWHLRSAIQVCHGIYTPLSVICRGTKRQHQGDPALSNARKARVRPISKRHCHMSGGAGLHAGEIEYLASRLVVGVRWLCVFARDELPNLIRESRPWCFILNTDPKDQPVTHWLALYAPRAGPIELFDSFGFSPINYSLDSLHLLHLGYPLQSPSTSVCGHYCIVYIYLRSRDKSLSELFHLHLNISNRDSWVARYIQKLQSLFRIRKLCHRTCQCCQLKCQFC